MSTALAAAAVLKAASCLKGTSASTTATLPVVSKVTNWAPPSSHSGLSGFDAWHDVTGVTSSGHTPAPLDIRKVLSSTPFYRDDRPRPASRMRGSPDFVAAFASLRPRQNRHPPRPACAAAARSCDPVPARSSACLCFNFKTEVHMRTQTARFQAWLADLGSIQAEIAASGMLALASRPTRKRTRALKPLWSDWLRAILP